MRVLAPADDSWRIHGISIGMDVKEVDALLIDRYRKNETGDSYAGYIDEDSRNVIGISYDNENVTGMVIGQQSSGDGVGDAFIGRKGTYLTVYMVGGYTMRIDILEIGENTLTFTLGGIGYPMNLLEEEAQIINSHTAQMEYYGFIITFTWTDENSIYVTHQGEITGTDSGTITSATDGQEYVWTDEFQ